MSFITKYNKIAADRAAAEELVQEAYADLEAKRKKLRDADMTFRRALKDLDALQTELVTLCAGMSAERPAEEAVAEEVALETGEEIVYRDGTQILLPTNLVPTLENVGRVLYHESGFVPPERVTARFKGREEDALAVLQYGVREQIFMRRNGTYRHRHAR